MFSFLRKKEQPPITVDPQSIHDFVHIESSEVQQGNAGSAGSYPDLSMNRGGYPPSSGIYPPMSPYSPYPSPSTPTRPVQRGDSKENQFTLGGVEFRLSDELRSPDSAYKSITNEIETIKQTLDTIDSHIDKYDHDFSMERGIVSRSEEGAE